METKKKSLREMMKNPGSWTDEEKEDYKKKIESFREFEKLSKAHNIDKELTNNTTKILSERFYKEFFIMAAILDAFFIKNEISFKELNQSIYSYTPKDFLWKLTINYQNLIILKMIRLGFIEKIETEDQYMPNFRITSEGIKIYQEQQLQNIAASSFFSYQAKNLNIKMMWLTVLMLFVTISSIIVTILSLKN